MSLRLSSERAYKKICACLRITLAVLLVFQCLNVKGGDVLGAPPAPQRKGLAVLNFTNTTSKQRADFYQPWEYGIAAMIITDIESIGLFNIVSRERLDDVLREQALQISGLVDPDTAVEVGRIVAAHYILAGSFMEMNGMLRIEAQVYSVENGSLLGAAQVTGETSKFFDIEKELVLKISVYLKTLLSEEEKRKIVEKIETKSVEASLNNYAGELAIFQATELKNEGRNSEAETLLQNARDRFKRALKHDPGYSRAKRNLTRIVSAIPLTL